MVKLRVCGDGYTPDFLLACLLFVLWLAILGMEGGMLLSSWLMDIPSYYRKPLLEQ